MIAKRLIVCLDVLDGRVVKGTGFTALRDIGDPVAMAAGYERAGADEIAFLDIAASAAGRDTMFGLIQETAERLFIPLAVGGGLRSVEDIGRALRSGADKVTLNTAALERPELIEEAARRFGAQCVVVSIDAARKGPGWEVYVKGGRVATGRDPIEWAWHAVERGAGEILLTSIDRDGARSGYDLALLEAVASTVSVPVIASGGAGSASDVVAALRGDGADAALVAGILHDGIATVRDLKEAMLAAEIPTRRTW